MFEVVMLISFVSVPLYWIACEIKAKRPQPMAVRIRK